MNNQRRALYLSHGGGPMPLLGDKGHEEMVGCLNKRGRFPLIVFLHLLGSIAFNPTYQKHPKNLRPSA